MASVSEHCWEPAASLGVWVGEEVWGVVPPYFVVFAVCSLEMALLSV